MTRPALVAGEAPSLRLLQATVLVSTLDRFAMPPLLVAIARDLDSPLSAAVHAAGLYYLAYGVCQPVWGIVSDRWGRVRTIRATLLLGGLATIVSALTFSPAALGAARGVAGALYGAAYPSALVYVGDTVPVSRRQPEVARLMVGVAVGTASASIGAGVLADVLTWRAAFLLTGSASLVVVWLLRRLPEPARAAAPASPVQSVRRVLGSPIAGLLLLLAFTEGVVLLGCLTLLPPAVEDAGATAALAGVVAGCYGLAVFGWSKLVSRLSGSWHPWRLIALGAVAATAACSVLAVSRQPVVALGAAVLVALAWTWMHSSLQTWATEVLPAARATIISFFAASLFVGSAAGAGLVGGLAEAGRYAVVFAAYAVLAVPLGAVAAVARARWRRPPDEQVRNIASPAPPPA